MSNKNPNQSDPDRNSDDNEDQLGAASSTLSREKLARKAKENKNYKESRTYNRKI